MVPSTIVHRLPRDENRAWRPDHEALVREAQRGNSAAFEELVRSCDQAVLRLAQHLTGSEHDAQDVFQDAFLRAYKNLPGFRFECSFSTWIYRIVANLCLDYLRKRRGRLRHVSTMVSAEGEESDLLSRLPDCHPVSDPERNLRSRELRAAILRALDTLFPRERLVFELRHYHGLRLRAVARMLNTTEGTAKNILFRATQKLRRALTEQRRYALGARF